MKVLVVGCGSIGTRRAKILADMGHEVCGKDPRWRCPHRRMVNGEWLFATESYVAELVFDAVLICTPPDSGRVAQVKELAPRVQGLFIEKPLALTRPEVDVLESWVRGVVPVTMGACNLRFSEGVDALRKIDGPRCGYFYMGMHRMYWSKGHQSISLILDSIHELDLAVWAMGPIISISGESMEDEAKVSVHHEHGYSTIYLDRLSDPPIREASVYPPDGLLVDHAPHIHINTDPSMYVREMQHFMDCVEAGVPTCNPIEDAAEVCRWALEVA